MVWNSIAIENKYGERGSPCLNPLELTMKPQAEPSIKTENEGVETVIYEIGE